MPLGSADGQPVLILKAGNIRDRLSCIEVVQLPNRAWQPTLLDLVPQLDEVPHEGVSAQCVLYIDVPGIKIGCVASQRLQDKGDTTNIDDRCTNLCQLLTRT